MFCAIETLPIRHHIRHLELPPVELQCRQASDVQSVLWGESMRVGRGTVLAVLPALVVLFVADQSEAYSKGHERVLLGDWRLTVTTDRFSGERHCRLATRRGSAVYGRGVVKVRLPRAFDPSQAVIRVDGGAPVRWRGLIFELARIDPGFASERDPQSLPVPAKLLKDAQLVEVSPAFGKRARRYRIAGSGAALERAAALGCRSDAAFVP